LAPSAGFIISGCEQEVIGIKEVGWWNTASSRRL